MALLCLFCRREIVSNSDRYSRVIAWEKPSRTVKSGKSGSSLVLREKTGQVACHSCITAMQHGIKVGQQESLFD